MIERLESPKLLTVELGRDDHPALMVRERAYLECGCTVWVGQRWDNLEVATSVGSCSRAHEEIPKVFNVLLFDSLEDPEDEDLVVVCERLLKQARLEVLGT